MQKRKPKLKIRRGEFFIHALCCGGHFELIYHHDSGMYRLACEFCGKAPGGKLQVTGEFMKSHCDDCKAMVPVEGRTQTL